MPLNAASFAADTGFKAIAAPRKAPKLKTRLALALTIALGALAALAPGAPAAVLTVNSTADNVAADGACTLREAITNTNDNSQVHVGAGECDAGFGPAPDTIQFSALFDGAVGTSTITVAGSPLPSSTESLIINAASANCTLAPPMGPCVGIDVTAAATNGLTVGDELLAVRGLAITGADTAIKATTDDGWMGVQQSWFGIKLDQSVDKNRVGVEARSDQDTIGGETPSDRNVFAANNSGGFETGAGIYAPGADSIQIEGNYFGVAPNGTLAAGMENGVNIRIVDTGGGSNPAESNTIGGPDAGTPGVCDGPCNLIANAIGTGVDLNGLGGLDGPATGSVYVLGNFIGLGLDGTSDVGNGVSGVFSGAAGLEVGSPNVADRNYIAGNDNTGVATDAGDLLAQNNYFGVNAAGTARVPANPTDTEQNLAVSADDAEVFGNRFGGSLVSLAGDSAAFQGNVVGVGTGGQDVGMDGYAMLVAGNFVDIGGADPGEGNVFGFQTGPQFAAIGLLGTPIEAQDAVIMGNHIGTDAGGGFYPNEGAGIEVGALGGTTTGAVIGACPACANVISNSGADAIRIEANGSDENRITDNTGRNNGRLDIHGPTNDLFIDLGTNGQGNGAAGPNTGIAAPVIGNGLSSSAATTTKLSGTSSEPNGTVIDVYTTYTRFADVKAHIAEGEVQNGAWSVTYPTALPKGTCITAAQSDDDNNTSELAPPVAVTGNGGVCDRAAPKTRITRVRKSFRGAGGKVTLRFRSSEKPAKFQCSRQRAPFRRCRSPKSFRRLPDGECHRIRVRAVDKAGNRDRTPAKVRVCVPPDAA